MCFVITRGNAMSIRPTYTLVFVTAVLLTTNVFASTCDAAKIDQRPCRATNRRLYEELQSSADEDYGGKEDSEVGGDQEPDDEPLDDDYTPLPPSPPPLPVYDKPRRGVRRLTPPALQKQYEKKFERQPYPGLVTASVNNLRATDTALLRGEIIELPTYVNVPVTLRCRFVPLEGTDSKFETVVESMYPGHADAPPPPANSHSSQIIRQLMGSVDGWRNAIDKSTRPVRKVLETRFGWPRTWPMDSDGSGEDDRREKGSRPEERYDGARGRRGWRPYAEDAASRQIAARRLAAERQQWFHGSRPNALLDPRRWFSDRRPIVRGQDSKERDNDRITENDLIEDQVVEQNDDHQPDEQSDDQQRDEQVDELQRDEQSDDQQRDEQIDDQQRDEQSDDQQWDEQSDDQQQDEQSYGQQRDERSDDQQKQADVQLAEQIDCQTKKRVECIQLEPVDDIRMEEPVNGQQSERSNCQMVDGRTAEDMEAEDVLAVDRAAEKAFDDRRVLDEVSVDELQFPAGTTEPKMATTTELDYATFSRDMPIKTFTKDLSAHYL